MHQSLNIRFADFRIKKNKISTDESGRPDGLFFYYSDTGTDLFCYDLG